MIERGVRVNALSPGPIETPIFGKMGLSDKQMEKMDINMTEMVPLKRYGRPEEMARAAVFLASSDSSYMVGAELVVDGGTSQL